MKYSTNVIIFYVESDNSAYLPIHLRARRIKHQLKRVIFL